MDGQDHSEWSETRVAGDRGDRLLASELRLRFGRRVERFSTHRRIRRTRCCALTVARSRTSPVLATNLVIHNFMYSEGCWQEPIAVPPSPPQRKGLLTGSLHRPTAETPESRLSVVASGGLAARRPYMGSSVFRQLWRNEGLLRRFVECPGSVAVTTRCDF